jgi:hypothetical protein
MTLNKYFVFNRAELERDIQKNTKVMSDNEAQRQALVKEAQRQALVKQAQRAGGL